MNKLDIGTIGVLEKRASRNVHKRGIWLSAIQPVSALPYATLPLRGFHRRPTAWRGNFCARGDTCVTFIGAGDARRNSCRAWAVGSAPHTAAAPSDLVQGEPPPLPSITCMHPHTGMPTGESSFSVPLPYCLVQRRSGREGGDGPNWVAQNYRALSYQATGLCSRHCSTLST